MRRREFIALLGGAAAAWSPAAHAQQPKQLPKVGWLKIQGRQHTPDQLQAFREGMRALGWVEERDYEIEERYADGDEARLPNLTTELLKAGVSVILATSQPSIIAAARVTRTVPVIGRMVDDPVADGMAQSLARPAGNVTGIYTMTEELNPKRLSLLKEAVPSVHRVGRAPQSRSPKRGRAASALPGKQPRTRRCCWSETRHSSRRRAPLSMRRSVMSRGAVHLVSCNCRSPAASTESQTTFRNLPSRLSSFSKCQLSCRSSSSGVAGSLRVTATVIPLLYFLLRQHDPRPLGRQAEHGPRAFAAFTQVYEARAVSAARRRGGRRTHR